MIQREQFVAYLTENAAAWIQSQRHRYRGSALPLTTGERDALAGLFEPGTLDSVRIQRVPRIENPTFYAELGEMPLDFTVGAGITFDDVVLISETQVPEPIRGHSPRAGGLRPRCSIRRRVPRRQQRGASSRGGQGVTVGALRRPPRTRLHFASVQFSEP